MSSLLFPDRMRGNRTGTEALLTFYNRGGVTVFYHHLGTSNDPGVVVMAMMGMKRTPPAPPHHHHHHNHKSRCDAEQMVAGSQQEVNAAK